MAPKSTAPRKSSVKATVPIQDEAKNAEHAAEKLADEVRDLGQRLHAKERELARAQVHASRKRAEADR